MKDIDIEGFDRREYNSVILAALLHDIGKFLQRKNDQTYRISHQETSASFIRDIGDKLKNDQYDQPYDVELVKFLVRHHHSSLTDALSDAFLKESKMPLDTIRGLIRIVKNADSYSCSERDQVEEERKDFADRHEPLKPIFLNISLGNTKAAKTEKNRYHLNCLDPFQSFPVEFDKLSLFNNSISGPGFSSRS